ncbi:MAG: hypothetical protein AMXMBFR56_26210 [Polyangiaceae bacterium]
MGTLLLLRPLSLSPPQAPTSREAHRLAPNNRIAARMGGPSSNSCASQDRTLSPAGRGGAGRGFTPGS